MRQALLFSLHIHHEDEQAYGKAADNCRLITVLTPLFFVVSSVGIIGTSCFSLAMQEQAKAAGSAAALLGLMSFILGGVMAPFVGIAGSFSALPMGVIIAFAEAGAVLSYLLLVRQKH